MLNSLRVRLLLVFLATLLLDLMMSVHLLTLTQNRMALAATTGAMLYFLSFFNQHLFIEEKTLKRRLMITAAEALGAACGTVLILSV